MNGTGEKPSGVISVPLIVGGLRGCTNPHTLLRRIANTIRPRPPEKAPRRRCRAAGAARRRRPRDLPAQQQDDDHHDRLAGEHVAPRELRRHPAADQRARGDRDGRDAAEQRVGQRAVAALVGGGGERCDRGHHQHGAEPLDPRPADQQDGEVGAQRRRERSDPVDRQADRERAVAAQDVAELRAEQHECRHHERVQRDRRLNALDRRVEVLDDLRDRHVHDARVEHHDELGRREHEQRKPFTHWRATLPGRSHLGGRTTVAPRPRTTAVAPPAAASRPIRPQRGSSLANAEQRATRPQTTPLST